MIKTQNNGGGSVLDLQGGDINTPPPNDNIIKQLSKTITAQTYSYSKGNITEKTDTFYEVIKIDYPELTNKYIYRFSVKYQVSGMSSGALGQQLTLQTPLNFDIFDDSGGYTVKGKKATSLIYTVNTYSVKFSIDVDITNPYKVTTGLYLALYYNGSDFLKTDDVHITLFNTIIEIQYSDKKYILNSGNISSDITDKNIINPIKYQNDTGRSISTDYIDEYFIKTHRVVSPKSISTDITDDNIINTIKYQNDTGQNILTDDPDTSFIKTHRIVSPKSISTDDTDDNIINPIKYQNDTGQNILTDDPDEYITIKYQNDTDQNILTDDIDEYFINPVNYREDTESVPMTIITVTNNSIINVRDNDLIKLLITSLDILLTNGTSDTLNIYNGTKLLDTVNKGETKKLTNIPVNAGLNDTFVSVGTNAKSYFSSFLKNIEGPDDLYYTSVKSGVLLTDMVKINELVSTPFTVGCIPSVEPWIAIGNLTGVNDKWSYCRRLNSLINFSFELILKTIDLDNSLTNLLDTISSSYKELDKSIKTVDNTLPGTFLGQYNKHLKSILDCCTSTQLTRDTLFMYNGSTSESTVNYLFTLDNTLYVNIIYIYNLYKGTNPHNICYDPLKFSPNLCPLNRMLYISKDFDLTKDKVIGNGMYIDTLSNPINIWINTTGGTITSNTVIGNTYINNTPKGVYCKNMYNDTSTNYTQTVYSNYRYEATTMRFTKTYTGSGLFAVASFNKLDGYVLKSFDSNLTNAKIVINNYIFDDPVSFDIGKEIIVNGPITIIMQQGIASSALSVTTTYYKLVTGSTSTLPALTHMYINGIPDILYYTTSANTYKFIAGSYDSIFVIYSNVASKRLSPGNVSLNYYPSFVLEKLFRQYLDIYIAFYQNVIQGYYRNVEQLFWNGFVTTPDVTFAKIPIVDILNIFKKYNDSIIINYKCTYGNVINLVDRPASYGILGPMVTPYNRITQNNKVDNITATKTGLTCRSPLLSPYGCLPANIKYILIEKSNLPLEGDLKLDTEQVALLLNKRRLDGYNAATPISPASSSFGLNLEYTYANNNILEAPGQVFLSKITSLLKEVNTSKYKTTYSTVPALKSKTLVYEPPQISLPQWTPSLPQWTPSLPNTKVQVNNPNDPLQIADDVLDPFGFWRKMFSL
jgi:hypothetical protein